MRCDAMNKNRAIEGLKVLTDLTHRRHLNYTEISVASFKRQSGRNIKGKKK